MQITGQNTIVGTLTLDLLDVFSRAYKSIRITNGQTIEISDSFRFDAAITDAVTGGFITITLENEDKAVQVDLTGGGSSDAVQVQNIVATNFTINHNNKNIVKITTDGGTYQSNSTSAIAAGTTDGQRLLIIAEPQSASITILNGARTVLSGHWAFTVSISPTVWLNLIWDGTNWNEISRNDGSNNNASGFSAHTEGQGNTAVGGLSHAEGSSNIATGGSSHVEGDSCYATGIFSHAEGEGNVAGTTPQSFSVSGTTVTISGFDATAQFLNGDTVFFYNLTGGTNNVLFSSSQGISSVAFDGSNTTFTISGLDDRTGGTCVDPNIGGSSHAEGSGTVAFGTASHAEGQGTTANGGSSHAEGNNNTAFSDSSHAEGSDTSVYGDSSHVEGRRGQVYGDYAHGEGYSGYVACRAGHVEGEGCNVGFQPDNFSISGSNVSIVGDVVNHFTNGTETYIFNLSGGTNNTLNQTTAQVNSTPSFNGTNTTFTINTTLDDRTSGQMFSLEIASQAHAEGINTNATGSAAHSEGSYTTASGSAGHAEGESTIATGEASHAEGTNTNAIGVASHTEGSNSISVGQFSHVEGNNSISSGDYSHAEGNGTVSGNVPQSFTISGTTVTISGDVRSQFINGNNTIFYNLSGQIGIYNVNIISVPSFNGTNTTFDIGTALGNATGGTCVQKSTIVASHAEGYSTVASGFASHAQGYWSKARQTGQHSIASGMFSVVGDAQATEVTVRNTTSDATPTALFVDGSAEKILIADHTTYGYSAKVIAKQPSGGSCAFFELSGFITRDTGVGTTRLISGSTTVTSDVGASTWTVVASADSTNGALIFTVTGAVTTTIQWVANVRLVETIG